MNQSARFDAEWAARECRAKRWFHPYVLPSGERLPSDHEGLLDGIHDTRWRMLEALLDREFPESARARLAAADLACHQGWFSARLAQAGFGSVRGFDARMGHVEDARLAAAALGLGQVCFEQADVHALAPEPHDRYDLVLCLGLIYHLEDPVGALRIAHRLCQGVCLVETQIAPGLSGWMDYGSYQYVRPIQGSFAIIDETGDTHGPEASTTGICLVPSLEALLWILRKVGFHRVEVLSPPADAYEQLAHNKRAMVAAWA